MFWGLHISAKEERSVLANASDGLNAENLTLRSSAPKIGVNEEGARLACGDRRVNAKVRC